MSRWAVVQSKRGAEVRLWVEDGEARDPLLATWQYELGRVAVVPLDFQGGASGWPTWRGFAKLWTQLAEWAAPRGLPSDHRLEATRRRDGTRIALDTVDDAAGPFTLRLDDAEDVALRQIGPRTFAATVPNLRPGLHPAVLVGGAPAIEERLDLLCRRPPRAGASCKASPRTSACSATSPRRRVAGSSPSPRACWRRVRECATKASRSTACSCRWRSSSCSATSRSGA